MIAIKVKQSVYSQLSKLKSEFGLDYSELIGMLIQRYKKTKKDAINYLKGINIDKPKENVSESFKKQIYGV